MYGGASKPLSRATPRAARRPAPAQTARATPGEPRIDRTRGFQSAYNSAPNASASNVAPIQRAGDVGPWPRRSMLVSIPTRAAERQTTRALPSARLAPRNPASIPAVAPAALAPPMRLRSSRDIPSRGMGVWMNSGSSTAEIPTSASVSGHSAAANKIVAAAPIIVPSPARRALARIRVRRAVLAASCTCFAQRPGKQYTERLQRLSIRIGWLQEDCRASLNGAAIGPERTCRRVRRTEWPQPSFLPSQAAAT